MTINDCKGSIPHRWRIGSDVVYSAELEDEGHLLGTCTTCGTVKEWPAYVESEREIHMKARLNVKKFNLGE